MTLIAALFIDEHGICSFNNSTPTNDLRLAVNRAEIAIKQITDEIIKREPRYDDIFRPRKPKDRKSVADAFSRWVNQCDEPIVRNIMSKGVVTVNELNTIWKLFHALYGTQRRAPSLTSYFDGYKWLFSLSRNKSLK